MRDENQVQSTATSEPILSPPGKVGSTDGKFRGSQTTVASSRSLLLNLGTTPTSLHFRGRCSRPRGIRQAPVEKTSSPWGGGAAYYQHLHLLACVPFFLECVCHLIAAYYHVVSARITSYSIGQQRVSMCLCATYFGPWCFGHLARVPLTFGLCGTPLWSFGPCATLCLFGPCATYFRPVCHSLLGAAAVDR